MARNVMKHTAGWAKCPTFSENEFWWPPWPGNETIGPSSCRRTRPGRRMQREASFTIPILWKYGYLDIYDDDDDANHEAIDQNIFWPVLSALWNHNSKQIQSKAEQKKQIHLKTAKHKMQTFISNMQNTDIGQPIKSSQTFCSQPKVQILVPFLSALCQYHKSW